MTYRKSRRSRWAIAPGLAAVGVVGLAASCALQPVTIDGNQLPLHPSDPDSSPIEVGTKFACDNGGYATGIRFYKGLSNTGVHTGHLWSRSGALLGSVTFSGESASGWQTADLGAAVPLVAGSTYVVSYFTPTGHYADDQSGLAARRTSGPLHSLADGEDGPNGVYAYGQSGSFPTQGWNASNYYVDIAAVCVTTSTTTPTPKVTPPLPTPTPPTPTPKITPPPPTPNPTGWPNAGNAGVPAGTALTVTHGDITITTPGTVVDAIDLEGGCISVQADNVTIKRTLIRSGCGGHMIDVGWGHHGVMISDVELDGLNANSTAAAVGDEGYTLLRCNIHNVGQGAHMNYGTVQDSYIHDIFEANGSHNEDIITNGGTGPSLVRHNNLENSLTQTGIVDLFGDFGPVANWTVDNNLINGGGYSIYGGSTASKPYPHADHMVFTNNHFGRKFYPQCGTWGPVTDFEPGGAGNLWSGNVWDDTGQPVGA